MRWQPAQITAHRFSSVKGITEAQLTEKEEKTWGKQITLGLCTHAQAGV